MSRLRRQAILAAAVWTAVLGQAAVLLAGCWGAVAALRWFLQAALLTSCVLADLGRALSLNCSAAESTLRPTLGWANGITLLRAGLISALAGFLFQRPVAGLEPEWLSWAPGVLYLIVSALDGLDGYVARVTGSETRLGERLDVEVDSLGLLVASALVVWNGKAPVFYLAVGLGVYGLRIATAIRRRRGKPVAPVPPRAIARWIAGCEMGLAGVALLPPFGATAVTVAAAVMTIALIGSLAWDWILICGKDDDISRVVSRYTGAVERGLPLMLRSALAAAAIAATTAGPLGAGGWAGGLAAAAALGCVMGLAARLAAMLLSATTALLLSSADPGSGMAVVLGCAVSLILTGAGPVRLWQPEDRWLLERQGKARNSVTPPPSPCTGPSG
jgi:CDP-diacylglycerol--glycerol-3-phosphate 3-phosphatidyltransferase